MRAIATGEVMSYGQREEHDQGGSSIQEGEEDRSWARARGYLEGEPIIENNTD
jgi:hypothetical protein